MGVVFADLEVCHEGRFAPFSFAGAVSPLAGKWEGGEGGDVDRDSME